MVVKSKDIESRDEFISMTESAGGEKFGRNGIRIPPMKSKFKPFKRESNSTKVIKYDIYEEDEGFVSLIKMEINDANITLQDIYASGLFEKPNQAYNLFYSLTQFHQISESRLKLWAAILKKNIVIALEDA